MKNLYDYYATQAILPTFAGLGDDAALDSYARARERLFVEKLCLPPALFRGAHVVEFGPDSGENALVFARWGALLTLVEPNKRAWPAIEAYFTKFSAAASLQSLVESDILTFNSSARFDIAIAEGFAHTVLPTSAWLRAVAATLRPAGFFVVSYYERYGALIELATAVLFLAAARAHPHLPPLDVAHRLYDAKWDSIPHTRTFESWTMDVLMNPFSRLKYFVDAAELCESGSSEGLELYSSWPRYRDELAVYWHKRILSAPERRAATRANIERSVLGFACGRKAYCVDPADGKQVKAHLDAVLEGLDTLAEGDDDAAARACETHLAELARSCAQVDLVLDRSQDRDEMGALMHCLARALTCVRTRDWNGLFALTSGDPAFRAAWGMPAHFSVFERVA